MINQPIFFYGLYMDPALLESLGLNPGRVGHAILPGYRIRIGRRATLVPAPGARACGVVIELPPEQVARLYARPEVADYEPRQIDVRMLDANRKVTCICYLLGKDNVGADTNIEYAEQLAALAASIGLPPGYVKEIARLGNDGGN